MKVSGTGIRTVLFTLDGQKVRTVKAANTRVAATKLTVASVRAGTHKLTAKVTFTNGAQKTLTLRFSRCSTAAVSPKFTG